MKSRIGSVYCCSMAALFLAGCASAGTVKTLTADPAPVVAPKATEPAKPPSERDVAAGAVAAEAKASGWRFSAAPYIWLFTMDGSVGKGGRTLPVSTHLSDSIELVEDHLDFGFAGHFEAQGKRWAFFLDGNYLKFSADGSASRSIQSVAGTVNADLEIDMDLSLIEAGWAYRMFEVDSFVEGRPAPIELIGGVRWNALDLEADLDVSATGAGQAFKASFDPDFSTDWFDPFIGVRTSVAITDKLSLRLRGDVGGGVGSGSDFAWNVVSGLTWQLNNTVDVFLGWRWYDFERESGGRDTELQMKGPGLGVSIRF